MKLVTPGLDYLPDYRAALERDWSPDNVRGVVAAREELTKINADPAAFVASLDDVEAKGEPVRLPDGTTVPRLPGYRRWMWDDGFCGAIGFRWRPGGSSLPPHVLGHIGYAVVPWRRNRGYARAALAQLLPQVQALGLDYVELTTDPDNIPSQRVIIACGGELVERFRKPAVYGGKEGLRYRISLAR